jgi:hypothetical protein
MKRFVLAAAAGGALFTALAAPAFAGTDFTKAMTEGKVNADIRARHEYVDADGLSDGAADTVRTRLGYTTGDFYNVSGMLEVENVTNAFSEDYNDGANGKTTRVSIADPETTEVNQAYLQYKAFDSTLRGGRQVISLGDERFMGDSGWRQNQTTFDAVRLQSKFVKHLDANYVYVDKMRNNLGDETATGERDSRSHVINLETDIIPHVTTTGFAYLIDLENDAPTLSSDTYGIQADVDYELCDNWSLLGTATYANQTDAGRNPSDYDLNFYRAIGGVGYKSLTTKVGYEVVEGDGTRSVTMPFADGNKTHGRSDVINSKTTIANGLEDLYVQAEVEVGGVHEYVNGISVGGEYHTFDAENGSADYGSEYDVYISKKFGKHYYADIVYANYDADTFSVDTQKLIFQVGAKF